MYREESDPGYLLAVESTWPNTHKSEITGKELCIESQLEIRETIEENLDNSRC